MRKLVVSIHSTANDIVTGPAPDETNFMAWAQAGIEDSMQDFPRLLENAGTIVLGRGTYLDLVRKWPHVNDWPDVPESALRIGERINTTPKVVVAGTHPDTPMAWGQFDAPTLLTGGDASARIARMKQDEGGDIVTFGSPRLVQSLTNAGLVDEYRILLHPVLMHEGERLFDHLRRRVDLDLLGVDTYPRGAVLLRYAPAAAS